MNKPDGNRDLGYKISFAFIRLFHDNVLLRLCVDPVMLLRDLGLAEGDRVLEVGCGPGFYTIGAAKATGPGGRVHSYDVNPYAIRYVRRRIQDAGFDNVRIESRSAADTKLPDASTDFAFVVGVPHLVGGAHSLFNEIARVVKPGGILAFRSSRGNVAQFVNIITQRGFYLEGKKERFSVFRKVT
jgi:ubiquinone/menaquinone biosynthesis C-methylase UbiE